MTSKEGPLNYENTAFPFFNIPWDRENQVALREGRDKNSNISPRDFNLEWKRLILNCRPKRLQIPSKGTCHEGRNWGGTLGLIAGPKIRGFMLTIVTLWGVMAMFCLKT